MKNLLGRNKEERGKIPQKPRKNTARRNCGTSSTQQPEPSRWIEQRDQPTRLGKRRMPWLKPVEPSPALPIGRGQGRTATCSWRCGLLIATAATTLLPTQHSYTGDPSCSEREAQTAEPKNQVEKGDGRAGQEKKNNSP
jgi:hypothetical protein